MKELKVFMEKRYYHPGEVVRAKAVLRTDKPIKARSVMLEVLGSEEVKERRSDY